MSDSRHPAIAPPADVAVIGLGNMGIPMAARLAGAGFRVHGFDKAEAMRQRFVRETGGRRQTAPKRR